MDAADHAADQKHQYDVRVKDQHRHGGDEHNPGEAGSAGDHTLGHGDGHVQHDGGHAGLHAPEHYAHHRVGAELGVEQGDNAQDDHGGQHRSHRGDDSAQRTADAVADHDGGVDRHDAWAGLGDGGQVHHLVLVDPAQLLHKFFLQEGNDDHSSSEGAGADDKAGFEQRPQSAFVLHKSDGCFHKSRYLLSFPLSGSLRPD